MKLTKKGREAEAKKKREAQTEGLRQAAENWNKMTEARKKAIRRWGKK